MPFIIHAKVVLWEASRSMIVEEGAVPAIQDVDVGIAEFWVVGSIDGAILLTNIRGPRIGVSKEWLDNMRWRRTLTARDDWNIRSAE